MGFGRGFARSRSLRWAQCPLQQEQTQPVPFSPETVTKLVVRVRLGVYKLRASGSHGGCVSRDEVRSDQHE